MSAPTMRSAKKPPTDILLQTRESRRMLENIPDIKGRRSRSDRRGAIEIQNNTKRRTLNSSLAEHRGVRYIASFPVRIKCKTKNGVVRRFTAQTEDISTTGMLLRMETAQQMRWMDGAQQIKMRFRIPPGKMPEGYEMKIKTKAITVHTEEKDKDAFCGVQFTRSLVHQAYKRKGRFVRSISILSLILLVIAVILMRVESILYFQFNQITYLYGIITASYLLSRYLFGALYKPVPINEEFTPGVTIVIPCFNEQEWIHRTIQGCIDQRYPPEQLEVIVVDDCSNDNSHQMIEEFLDLLEQESHEVRKRVRYVRQEVNQGKREAMARGSRMAKFDLVVFVDSDSFLDPYAIVNLVQPFQDPKVGGVSGRTDVANGYTNFVTKMQSVRYYISFRIMKAAEGYFDSVTCLSGPLSCYRKEVLLDNLDPWLNQKFLGQRATFGDDRSMTNFILRTHRTTYQDTAICSTIAPNTHKMFLKQQMRWKRSWLRESSLAARFMWKKEPLMALSFYFGFLIPILAPIIVLYNLVYIPTVYGFFPRTFLLGLLAMSMLMSMAQLLLRRSKLWLYGAYYCIYHLLILMWQMPYAWVTFWKSTWGTRMTPEDIAVLERRRGIKYTEEMGKTP